MKLALGSAQFGLPYGISNKIGTTSFSELVRILELALSSGIALIDTAIAYGESETRLGKVGVEAFKLVTKLPSLPQNCPDAKIWAENQLEDSLQRLGLKNIYGLLLHSPTELLTPHGPSLFAALEYFKMQGLVKKIGISVYSPAELDAILPLFPFDLVQAPFNLVDQRLKKSGWMHKLHESGIEIHVRSVFLQGLLLMDVEQIPDKFSRWGWLWKKWHNWLIHTGISPQTACLGFAKSMPEINQIVVGVESQQQLNELIDSMKSPLPDYFPSIECDDLDLINPSKWSKL